LFILCNSISSQEATLMRAGALLFFLGLASLDTTVAFAQARWFEVEPKFPPTCIVLRAGVKFQMSVQIALKNCLPNYAVELAAGPNRRDNSFVIDPITLPRKVSLIVDGGVTDYGTTDASRYQIPSAPGTCGTVGPYPVYGICKPLISFTSGSGIYGYGIIDGQGQMPVRVKGKTIPSWWYLLTERKQCPSKSDDDKTCQEANPLMISAGNMDGSSTNLVLYKITLRNPPFHTIRLSGSHVTAWDVKVQAPWNVPNTDGFDVHGNDILIKDSIVANGDQDIALTSAGRITSDVMVDGLRAYGKGGVALLDDGPGFSGIMIDDFAMTGDLPSVVGSTVNGVTERQMQAEYGVNYGQALPSATGDSQGMQINTGLDSTSLPPSRSITNVSFSKVCMSDIVRPIHIGPLSNPDPNNPPKDWRP
jgi:polygalacturonase